MCVCVSVYIYIDEYNTYTYQLIRIWHLTSGDDLARWIPFSSFPCCCGQFDSPYVLIIHLITVSNGKQAHEYAST